MATLAELLVQIGVDAKDLISGIDDTAREVENKFGGMSAGMAASGAVIGGALAMGISSAMDISSAQARLTAQLDLTEDEAARAGDAAGAVFTAGFGASMDEAAAAVSAVASSVVDMADVSDAELEDLSATALTLSDVFDIDVAEGALAAGQMIKTGLAANGQEAFDLLTAGATALPERMRGELPDVINEYAANFAQLGLSGDQMFGMLAAAADSSGWSIDQAADAVRELGIRVMNVEKPEAIEALGFDAEDMAARFAAGGDTAQQAVMDLWDALVSLDDPLQQQQIGAELFGSMWEDSGAQAILAMNPAEAALTDVAGAAQNVVDTMEQSPAQQFDSAFRTLSETLGQLLLPILTSVANFAAEHPTLFKIIAGAVLVAAVAFTVLSVALWAVNAAVLANPITWIIIAIIAGIVLLIAAITAIVVYWDEIVAATVAAWEWIKSALAAAWNWIKSTAESVWNAVAAFFTGLWDSIVATASSVWESIKAFFAAGMARASSLVQSGVQKVLAFIDNLRELPGRVGRFFANMVRAAADKIAELLGKVRAIPGKIKSALGNLGSLLLNAGKNIIRGLINGVNSMIGSLRNKFSSITNMIPDWKGPMRVDRALLVPTGQAIMGGLSEGITAGLPGLRDTLGDVTDEIPRNVTARVSHTGGTTNRVVLDVTGTDEEMARLIRKMVRVRGRGDVQKAFGG